MLKQSMFQLLDIGRHCICVQIRAFWHTAQKNVQFHPNHF